MEKIILAVIGVAAVGFLARLLLREAKGEVKCPYAEDNCSSKRSTANKKNK